MNFKAYELHKKAANSEKELEDTANMKIGHTNLR